MQTQTTVKRGRGGKRENTRRKDGEIRGAGGKLLNSKALVKELGVTANWLSRKLRQAEPIPHIRLPNTQRYWFDLDVVLAWFRAHAVKPAPTVVEAAEAPATERQPRRLRRRKAR